MVEQLMIAVVVVAVAWKAVGGRRRVRERHDGLQVALLLDFIVSSELLDGVVDGEGWLVVLEGLVVEIHLDGARRGVGGKEPTAADADVDNHLDAPAHNAVRAQTSFVHEGVDAHAQAET